MTIKAEGAKEAFADLDAALDWLHARQFMGIQPGLERVTDLLARLGNPERRFSSVLVAGTNGKGSVSSSLAAMLQASGGRTALFISPHLSRFAERFSVAGEVVSEAALLAAIDQVRPHAEAAEATFFEILVAVACLIFAEQKVVWAVMEVGLGGRFDATNALDPVLSVVTNVGLDHTEILGDTVQKIAAEKAGVARAERPLITAVDLDILPIFEATGAKVQALKRDFFIEDAACSSEGSSGVLAVAAQEVAFRSTLLGEHGLGNAALALRAALALGVAPEVATAALARSRWPGRMERIEWRGRSWLLDGAHNPDGAAALTAACLRLGLSPRVLVFGAMADKDLAEVAAALSPLAKRVLLTRSSHSPRAAAPEELLAFWRGAETAQDLPAALERAVQVTSENDLILIAGSLHLVGEARVLLLGADPESYIRLQ